MSAQPYPNVAPLDQAREASPLSSRRGVAILLLLSLVQFMDILIVFDTSGRRRAERAALPLAASGYLNPLIAGAATAFSSGYACGSMMTRRISRQAHALSRYCKSSWAASSTSL